MIWLIYLGISFIAGIVQGVTGFGSMVVIMMVLPYFFDMPRSAGIAMASGFLMCLLMMLRYKKDLNLKNALLPLIVYIPVSTIAIRFSVYLDQGLAKKILGAFFLFIAVYNLLLKKDSGEKRSPIWQSVLYLAGAAVCDGLFGTGGAFMVLYFLGVTTSVYGYFGSLQLFFLVTITYNTTFRFIKGILLPEHIPLILIGIGGMTAGLFIANKIVDRLDAGTIRKLTYVLIGISGIINLVR